MATNKIKTSNARMHKRLKASFLMRYELIGTGKPSKVVNLQNLSAGGFKFLTRDVLEEGSRIRFWLLIAPLDKTIPGEAQVLRVRRAGKTYASVAAKFVNILQHEQALINDFIEGLASDHEASEFIDDQEIVFREESAARS